MYNGVGLYDMDCDFGGLFDFLFGYIDYLLLVLSCVMFFNSNISLFIFGCFFGIWFMYVMVSCNICVIECVFLM